MVWEDAQGEYLPLTDAELWACTGMGRSEFAALAAEVDAVAAALRAGSTATMRGHVRRRRTGAGRRRFVGPEARLLMAILRARHRPSFKILGDGSLIHRRNAQLIVRETLAAIATMPAFPLDLARVAGGPYRLAYELYDLYRPARCLPG